MVAERTNQSAARQEVRKIKNIQRAGQGQESVQHLPLLLRCQGRLKVLDAPQLFLLKATFELFQCPSPVFFCVRGKPFWANLFQWFQMSVNVLTATMIWRPIDVNEKVKEVHA